MNSTIQSINRLLYGPLLAAAYAVTGKLGLMLALPPGYASGVFPTAGLSVATVYLWGRSAYLSNPFDWSRRKARRPVCS